MKRFTLLASTMVLAGAGMMAGCLRAHGEEEVGSSDSAMTPLDRLLIGQATDYPADPNMRASLPDLAASQAKRRAQAWEIVKKVLAPVAVDAGKDGGSTASMPRFQTWYAKDEILPMFDRLLRQQTAEERAQKTPPSAAQIAAAFEWQAERAKTLPSWSQARLDQRRAEIEADGPAALGGPERVLMSPALVGHLYAHYDAILGCVGNVPDTIAPPPSATNFAPCVGEEFPIGSVVVKARWIPDTLPLEAHDTSAAALTSTITTGEWPVASRTVAPDDRGIYTMKLASGIRMRLAALHIATKELRDWMWITLFWSDTPAIDFGADRPSDITGPFANYKMCTTVAFDEEDNPPTTRPDAGVDDASTMTTESTLAAAHAATRAFGPRTWCSNPYLEHGPGNAKTNCIGCHQHGGTTHTSQSILEGPTAFPDGSREKIRTNFPADYLFITGTGLELAALMKAKVDQLSGL